MAHHQDRAGILDQHRLEQFEGLRVQIVGRLVQDEHIRRPRKELGQQEPVSLPAGEDGDRGPDLSGRKQEVLQVADDVPGLAVHEDRVPATGHVLLQGLAFIQLGPELIKIGHLQTNPLPHRPCGRLDLPQEELKQGGLARSRWAR